MNFDGGVCGKFMSARDGGQIQCSCSVGLSPAFPGYYVGE